jgi:hypothetical protein
MMPQNNGSKQSHLPNSSDSLPSLEMSCSPESSILEFLERFTKSQMDFVVAMMRIHRYSSHDSVDIRSWLMFKAKQYDNRLKPLNPRLEFRSNDELLEFITTCKTAETNCKHSF